MSDKKNILVVDDEEVIREFLYEVLSEDYSISTATDGDEAIEQLKDESFDLVITDLKMKRVQGEEVVRFSNETNPASKVIVMSGYASLYSASQSVNNGAYAFLSKPFTIQELISSVEGALTA